MGWDGDEWKRPERGERETNKGKRLLYKAQIERNA
jgi:hypothetical protein